MPTVEQELETPAEMQARLERMGEVRVRSLLDSGYFDPRTMGLVKGWLDEKDRRRGVGPEAQTEQWDKELEGLTARLRKAEAAVKRSAEDAAAANRGLERATRMTRVSLILGSLAVVVSIVALFLAIAG